METTMNKSDLVSALRANREQVVEELRDRPAAFFTRGRYENGWNGREILAHIASMEWTYPNLVRLAEAGNPPEGVAAVKAFDVEAYNQKQVGKRADRDVEQLLAEFQKNREATIAAIEGVDDDVLEVKTTSGGGHTGRLKEIIHLIAVEHTRAHLDHIVSVESVVHPQSTGGR